MSNPLTIFPILLFFLALLAFVSGIGVIYVLRTRRAGAFTTFIWAVFSASISTGFITFALFVYATQHTYILPIVISAVGIIAVLIAGRLATL